MKRPFMRLAMTVPLSLLLALLFTVSISSCSKPDLANIVREHIAAVNTDDIEKNLTFFTDDAVFEPEPSVKLSGKAQLRNLMEGDVVNNARLSIEGLKVKGNTVLAELTEKNEGYRLLGIDILPFTATYEFEGHQIRGVKLEFSPDNSKIFEDKFGPIAEWAKQAHPEEYQKMSGAAGYSAEGTILYLSLMKEWREKIEMESVGQELTKLENKWAEAWVKNDVAFHDRIMADDYTWISPWGKVFSKADNLAALKSGSDVIESWVLTKMKVRVYGQAAVVTGLSTIKETFKGRDVSGQERWTHTRVKLAGRWQCVAAQSSEIAQK